MAGVAVLMAVLLSSVWGRGLGSLAAAGEPLGGMSPVGGGVSLVAEELLWDRLVVGPLAASQGGVGGGGGGSAPSWRLSWSLASAPPLLEELAVDESCRELLRDFANSCASLVDCALKNARPVRLCEDCIPQFHNFWGNFDNISKSSGNISCSTQLLRSDRLQLVLKLYRFLQEIWSKSNCDACLNESKTELSADSLIFKKMLNNSLNCFEQYSSDHPNHNGQPSNLSILCTNCKESYKNLTAWYNKMQKNQNLCIDIEDAMNLTRQLWSKTYNCTVPCSDTIPVIAVSVFLLFLPVIFYLSSFLHSEQKKWKLIQPKRLKTYSSVLNIQDQSSCSSAIT
ncbi:osteopetrosis-associated transmembrane protein 1 precursor [Callorhinchus milii]|uniref:Osteopetrosis associated transmembrane protein 1-like protein n=1 Tax=Callorhinchus milii TaxID=7868 RepID=K4FUM2_CALMI|nr:osteopetrosis-associated transmembrane protein 1 precursor [Callorhinchus milii]AFK11229.1 osteopetrosis associated transmembrane protein 1-like protein [Callorhinchus milii]